MLYGVEYESRKIGSLNCDEPAAELLLRCESCGQKVDALEVCKWDASLQVGPCCRLHSDEHPEVFELTSPTIMPRLEPIAVRPVIYKGVA